MAVARGAIRPAAAHVKLTAGAPEPRFETSARRPLAPVHPAVAGISSGIAPNRHASKTTATGTDLALNTKRPQVTVIAAPAALWPAAAPHDRRRPSIEAQPRNGRNIGNAAAPRKGMAF